MAACTLSPESDPRLCTSRRFVLLALLFMSSVISPAAAAAADDARPVLVRSSYEREFAPHKTFAEMFRGELGRVSPQPIHFVEVSLIDIRADRSDPNETTLNRLRARFSGDTFDLVVSIGGPAAMFAQKFRSML